MYYQMLSMCCWFCSFSCNHLWLCVCLCRLSLTCLVVLWIFGSVCFCLMFVLTMRFKVQFWWGFFEPLQRMGQCRVGMGGQAKGNELSTLPVSQKCWAGSCHLRVTQTQMHTCTEGGKLLGEDLQQPSYARLMTWSWEVLDLIWCLIFILLCE